VFKFNLKKKCQSDPRSQWKPNKRSLEETEGSEKKSCLMGRERDACERRRVEIETVQSLCHLNLKRVSEWSSSLQSEQVKSASKKRTKVVDEDNQCDDSALKETIRKVSQTQVWESPFFVRRSDWRLFLDLYPIFLAARHAVSPVLPGVLVRFFNPLCFTFLGLARLLVLLLFVALITIVVVTRCRKIFFSNCCRLSFLLFILFFPLI